MSLPRAFALLLFIIVFVPSAAQAQGPSTGGAEFVAPPPENMTAPGAKAKMLPDGSAAAPAGAPAEVQKAIWAANKLLDKPYRYGGGHAKIEDTGYDCSGTVSYALFHAGLLKSPLDSGSFLSWGQRGRGQWITVFTNRGHAYAVIAGLRLDTSSYASRTASKRKVARTAFERGPRWRPTQRPARGFTARHPTGL